MNRPLSERAFLAAVETALDAALATVDGDVGVAARATVHAGGKRLRPMLVAAARPVDLADDDIDRWNRTAPTAAAAVELIHAATLVHDDVLDGAALRRGVATVHTRFDAAVAVGAGDAMFARAFAVLVSIREAAGVATTRTAIQILAGTSKQLAEGEALQAQQIRDTGLAIDDYLLRCRLKTGALLAASMQLGALYAGADTADLDVLLHLGHQLGTAFQIVDDILDISPDSTDQALGKQPGADIRDGTMTAPLLFAIAEDPSLADLVHQQPASIHEVIKRVHLTDAARRSTDLAERCIDQARGSLQLLRSPCSHDILERLFTDVIHRIA